jgi:carboxylesterase type B
MANPTPPVTIQSGTLTGAYDKAGDIAIFKGIPFAQPPVNRPSRPRPGMAS